MMSHTPGPMEVARRQWWDGLSEQGDPMRIVNPLSSGFRAGWEAAGSINAELLEALRGAVGNLRMAQVLMDSASRALCQSILKDYESVIAKATGGA